MKAFLVLLIAGLALGTLFCTLYGLFLAFSASVILGIIALLVEPSPFIIGLVMVLFQKNLAELIMAFLNK